MKIVQVDLQSDHHEVLTTWVDQRPKLKVGSIITLLDFKPETRWVVVKMYSMIHDSHEFDFHRKWDNNDYSKHRGLNYAPSST